LNSFFYIHKLLFFGVCVSAILTACGAERPLPLLTRVETIAGSNGEFGEPFGIAFKGGEVYVSDGEKGKIVKIDREGRVKEFGWVDTGRRDRQRLHSAAAFRARDGPSRSARRTLKSERLGPSRDRSSAKPLALPRPDFRRGRARECRLR
jgi:hypothetical protein